MIESSGLTPTENESVDLMSISKFLLLLLLIEILLQLHEELNLTRNLASDVTDVNMDSRPLSDDNYQISG